MKQRPRDILRSAGCAVVAALLGACGAGPKAAARMPGAAVRASAVPQPAARGLEMYWWGFDDGGDGAALARKLRQYVANPVPISDGVRSAWRLNGLRIVSLPRQDLAALEAELRVAGVQRKILGELTSWGTLAAGPAWSGQQRLQMAEGELPLDAGRLRIIARAWTAADIVEGRDSAAGQIRYVTRIELGMQHEEREGIARNALNPEAVENADGRGIVDKGLVLSRTIANFDLWPNEAVLIFPEPPGADLAALAGSRPEPESVSADAGPEIPRLPTAGELMLCGKALGRGTARRAIIVLTHAKPPQSE